MAGDSSSTSCDDSFRALPQAAPSFGTSRSAADRTHLAPLLAIVDGALVPSRDHTVAASSKNYQYSTNTQVGIDANSRLVVAIGRCPAASNDPQAFTASGGDQACRGAPTITDGRYQGTACSSRTRPDAPQPSRGSTTWPSTDISHPIQDNLTVGEPCLVAFCTTAPVEVLHFRTCKSACSVRAQHSKGRLFSGEQVNHLPSHVLRGLGTGEGIAGAFEIGRQRGARVRRVPVNCP